MFIIYILIIIIIFLVIAHIIDHRAMQGKLETERYAKGQLVNKLGTMKNENMQLKNQILNIDGNKDTYHHGIRKARQDLYEILGEFNENQAINHYEIVPTSNLAVRHPLFDIARTFDYIVLTDKGIFNIDVKNWKQKTFYHFTVDPNQEITTHSRSIHDVVGHYIAKEFHNQFQSTRPTTYTFIERIKNNSIIYDFYQHDPFERAAQNAQIMEEKLGSQFNQVISSIGLVYFTDGSVNIIDGPSTREQYADTVSSKSSLKEIIGETVRNNSKPLSKEQFEALVKNFN
ncbi:hypothetical protein N9R04_02565 [Staphylococcus sp. SQ8-PEA]|uniref:NERD domain-containing protein n=1 Tax=Staphylococcus marylandisciuri TaxID=2981529 RepID=A0ABT2QNQ7_9STAP|nr:hypothetical protein [Staphylococcus marylandisciuri]MCU5745604.1 hypothetical protein [Staphylococcus marylandisciuri]